jgi:hypothetical protein
MVDHTYVAMQSRWLQPKENAVNNKLGLIKITTTQHKQEISIQVSNATHDVFSTLLYISGSHHASEQSGQISTLLQTPFAGFYSVCV